jgi:hypothetical protein
MKNMRGPTGVVHRLAQVYSIFHEEDFDMVKQTMIKNTRWDL